MEMRLFTSDSIWTMVHGIVLGGGAMLALFAALFSLRALRVADGTALTGDHPAPRELAWLMVGLAVVLWLTVIIGTYITFPPYRATPPEGLTDLSEYPRALIRSSPSTAWLHSYAMETKEHVPWIAAMLGTAAAFIGVRFRSTVLRDGRIRGLVMALLAMCFILVSYVSLLGVLVNKAAPLD
jgi:hypothetical protein